MPRDVAQENRFPEKNAGRCGLNDLAIWLRPRSELHIPDRRYRTAPLKGLWAHTKGGFFHDGRFPTLAAVVDHYNRFFGLGTSSEQSALIEYLKSL